MEYLALKIVVAAVLFFVLMGCACIRRTPKPERNCYTCRNHLGACQCRINLEAECGKGEYEAWEPKEENNGER